MEQKAGAQIGKRAFIQSLVILFVLMMIAGILTLVIPAGRYTRLEVDTAAIGDTVGELPRSSDSSLIKTGKGR